MRWRLRFRNYDQKEKGRFWRIDRNRLDGEEVLYKWGVYFESV